MNIGTKLKDARVAARLTQEQVAQELGVSRQTISNWETEKTYPDIVSVIKMSDLYSVSLDHLLKGKEEQPMSDYMDYLEESTNTVRSKTRLSKTILIATYLSIWAFSLIVFWFFTSGSDAMGFALIFLWVLIPVTTLVISILIGRNNYWCRWNWLAPPILGIMYMLAEYATFSTANMVSLSFSRINMPQFDMIFVGGAISALGLGVGSAIRRLISRR